MGAYELGERIGRDLEEVIGILEKRVGREEGFERKLGEVMGRLRDLEGENGEIYFIGICMEVRMIMEAVLGEMRKEAN